MADGTFRSGAEQGIFPFEFLEYGRSVEGVPLRYLPAKKEARLLIFAGIHGEEWETTFLLSRALRKLHALPDYVACILITNPDGVLRSTRCNANGVDLNRNFPTSNWSAEKVLSRLVLEAPRETELSPGNAPASEPETKALMELIQNLGVKKVVSLHAPFGLIDSDSSTELSKQMESIFALPWQSGVGYPTPGSFGTYAAEKNLECVTVELPREAPEILAIRYAEPLAEFLRDFTK
ncbi:MAG: murein tripeptide amidase MpaA [Fibrobacter sp.]|nr:murein tripeptide amidase MpaA [Fibrobacter sp.]